jgi:hypothetical protein
MLVAVAGTTFIAGFVVGFIAGLISSGSPNRPTRPPATVAVTTSAPALEATRPATAPPKPKPSVSPTAPVIAWQPSHQKDTAATPGYLEYQAMGALAKTTSRFTTGFRTVLAWDTTDGLYGANTLPNPTNVKAFKKELTIANSAKATYFVGLQSEVGPAPKIVVYYQENDDVGATFAGSLAQSLSTLPGFPGASRLGVRFYSLDGAQNAARYRAIIEFRAPTSDLVGLTAPARQRIIAKRIAAALLLFDQKLGTRTAI